MGDRDLIEFSSSDEEEPELSRFAAMPMKRMAVVDTCNVLYQCAGMAWNCRINDQQYVKPEAIGVMLLVRQLLMEEFDLRLFILRSYMNPNKVLNYFILETLHHLGVLMTIDDGSHDDLVVLELAKSVGGFVISNDKYRDHLTNQAVLFNTIRRRTCDLKFDHIPLANVGGVSFLCERKHKHSTGLLLTLKPQAEAFFAKRDDPTYSLVYQHRVARDKKLAETVLEEMDICADYIQETCVEWRVKPPTLDYFPFHWPPVVPFPPFDKFRDAYFAHKRRMSAANGQ